MIENMETTLVNLNDLIIPVTDEIKIAAEAAQTALDQANKTFMALENIARKETPWVIRSIMHLMNLRQRPVPFETWPNTLNGIRKPLFRERGETDEIKPALSIHCFVFVLLILAHTGCARTQPSRFYALTSIPEINKATRRIFQ
jgi:hypothetical protein